jgi:hypothetical protein
MRQNLEKLRDKLSDLSKRNRSLRLLRLYDKWNFDLSLLEKIEGGKHADCEQIITKLLGGSGSVFIVGSQVTDEAAANKCP